MAEFPCHRSTEWQALDPGKQSWRPVASRTCRSRRVRFAPSSSRVAMLSVRFGSGHRSRPLARNQKMARVALSRAVRSAGPGRSREDRREEKTERREGKTTFAYHYSYFAPGSFHQSNGSKDRVRQPMSDFEFCAPNLRGGRNPKSGI